jgi:uncharacterized membrane protein YccC
MNAVLSTAPLRDRLLKEPGWLERETVVGLIFSLKTYAASMLALFIAFWAALDDPRWAVLTVFVVSQPDSGLVVAKSVYRMLGTIAGVLVSIALVFAFAQYGELFLASLAAWIAFCCFAARTARNFASYGFQLAGYTAAIVGLPAALEPSGAYPLIVARFTEISLGIGCAALVSRLFFVRELRPKVVALVHDLTRRADHFAALAIDPAADRERIAAERAQLTKDFVAVEAMQQSAFFESADARLRYNARRELRDAAVELCAVAEGAAARRVGPVPHPATTSLRGLICDANDTPAGNGAVVSTLVRAADEQAVARARARLRQSVTAFERGEDLPAPDVADVFWPDPVGAAVTAIRAVLAIAITSAFWFVTAWPNGPIAVVVAAVVCTLFATMQQPGKIALACIATVLVAAVPVFVTQFHLMPLAVDFPSMAVAIAPLLLISGYILAQPGIGPLGMLSAVYFTYASQINNVMSYDAVAFLNSSFAVLVGIGVGAVLFATFFPETSAHASRRFRRQILVHLSRLASARRPDVRSYERALCEQLWTMLAGLKDEPAAAHACLARAVAGLSAGQAIGRLRTAIDAGTLAPGIAAKGSDLLDRLSRSLLHPSPVKFVKAAWAAHALRCDALAAARVTNKTEEIEVLGDVLVGSEVLRSDLMRARVLLQEEPNVLRN